MEINHGKLFVGGISWDTNEDLLKDYFSKFGDVAEAVVMRDRATKRARGFGFVVFADPAVAERVVQQKHMIAGRIVEAKKAVPRDDQNNNLRNVISNNAYPSPFRTKKIFVGGLPSSITESDFKRYFDQFGLITDLVVMHDHNTQRPRGFGFITYDTEDAVDRVLYKTFHELKGKMVEVKRAVPKESSPSPNRSPLSSHGPGMSRVSSFTIGYSQGDFTSSPGSDYAPRSGSRVSPGGVPSHVSLYGRGLHGELNLNSSFGINGNPNQNVGYATEYSPLYRGISGRPIDNGPSGSVIGGIPLLNQDSSSLWGDVGLNFTSNSVNITGPGSDNPMTDPYKRIRKLWGSSSSLSDHGGFDGTEFGGFMSNIGSVEGCYSGSHRRTSADLGVVGPPSSYMASEGGHLGNLDLYESSSAYGDPSWRSSSSSLDMEDSSSLNLGLGNTTADAMTRVSAGYVGYGMATVK